MTYQAAPTPIQTKVDPTRAPLALVRGDAEPAGAGAHTGLPSFGDVVSCYFPEDETPNSPGIKARPCLILQMRQASGDSSGRWYALVAYGTSVNLDQTRPGELLLDAPESLAAASLHRPSKFVFKRHRLLPFDARYFRANRNKTVVLGRLTPQDISRARAAIAEVVERATSRRAARSGMRAVG